MILLFVFGSSVRVAKAEMLKRGRRRAEDIKWKKINTVEDKEI